MSRVKDCYYSGHEAHWSIDVTQATRIISRAFSDTEWCLDSGANEADGHIVYLNKVSFSALSSSKTDDSVREYCARSTMAVCR
jgi:hypothetical protein